MNAENIGAFIPGTNAKNIANKALEPAIEKKSNTVSYIIQWMKYQKRLNQDFS